MNRHLRSLFIVVSLAMPALAWAQPEVPPTLTLGNLTLDISKDGQRAIQEEVDRLHNSASHFQELVRRANLYFPLVEQAFLAEGVPDEFKYLCLQESALIGDAVSKSNAVGYWQFKQATAEEMGLRVDPTVDERKHIVRASGAAARYLKQNNKHFDNWVYALQAYMQGAGGTLRSTSDRHYGKRTMPINRNTHWYVLRFLGHWIAFEPFVRPGQNAMRLSEVAGLAGSSRREVAAAYLTTESAIEQFNLWWSRGRVPQGMTVIVPTNAEPGSRPEPQLLAQAEGPKVEVLLEKWGHAPVDPNLFPKVSLGEELSPLVQAATVNGLQGVHVRQPLLPSAVASRTGVEVQHFLKWNDLDQPKELEAGYYYTERKRRKARAYFHTLRPQESLWQVSQRYGVRLNKLLRKNRLSQGQQVQPGTVLWIRHIRPASEPVVVATVSLEKSNEPQAMPEKPTDTAAESTLVQPLTPSALEDTENTAAIEPLAKPADAQENDRDAPPQRILHTVRPGETMYGIARKYGVSISDVQLWNGLTGYAVQVGQELVVGP